MNRWAQVVLVAAIAGALTFAPASGATIVPLPGNGDCKLSLNGVIEQGDFKELLKAEKVAFTEDVSESTSANTICLNSPGGSLYEGMLFARHFYETGVGTVVRSGELCASACALMFMMGRAAGAEVSFINRKLHIGGKLGFHRPSLSLPAVEGFGSGDIEASYDMAVTSVVDYIVLANKSAPWSSRPMVHSDLVERIFATPADDMFFIDTVEHAARWDIELVGVETPGFIDEERAYYACENALQWSVALHESPLDFVALNLGGHWTSAFSYQVPTQQGQRFAVTSSKAGYASAGCLVDFTEQRLRICGQDEYTGTSIGDGTCSDDAVDGFSWVTPLALWQPNTKLIEMNGPWVPQGKWGICRIHSPDGALIDDERCVVGVDVAYAGGNVGVVKTFTWPSGNKTLVSSYGSNHQINSDPAETAYVEGQDACYVNARSNNRFCFKAE